MRCLPTLPLFLLLAFLISRPAVGSDDLTVLPKSLDGRPCSEMMPRYLKAKMHEAMDRRGEAYEKIKTPEDIQAYQKKMRAFFVEQLGGLPKRTPLNARVVGKLQRDGYRIEKVIYESRPGLFVTALLYLPEAKPPYPGVLVPCGHFKTGKACDTYQKAAILLARNGMAALCFDPLEQGERYQCFKKDGTPRYFGTDAHDRIGVGSILLGRNAATFFVWDGIRGIDYLVSRPEIDPKRIGCTGNSGGGTQTAYLMALDDRIQCAAPSCYLTSFGRLIETIGAQDAEQNIHGQLAFGMGHADYIHMRAPKPTLMCTATQDFFDIRGSWQTFREAKRLYGRLGFAERVDLVETDATHGFSSPLRVAAVRWMRRWLMGVDDAITEPEKTAILSEEQACCAPNGGIMSLDGAKTTFDVNREYEAQLAKKRRAFWAKATLAEALDAVRRVTGIRPLDELPRPKVEKVGCLGREDYRIEKLILQPEPGIWLPALMFVPEKELHQEAYLILEEKGKTVAVDEAERLVKKGHRVLAVDVRGIGETQGRAKTKNDRKSYLGPEWKETTLAYLLDRPYLTMRTEDILVCARFLAGFDSPEQTRPVWVMATGVLGPPALHAAALEPDLIDRLTLRGALISWADVVPSPRAKSRYVNVVHGALKVYDLPDLVKILTTLGKIEVIDPRRADGKPAKPSRK